MIAYWLVPTEPARSELVSLIGSLARKYNAPVFEPHLTLYASDDDEVLIKRVVMGVAATTRPITLTIERIDHSEEFTKTLFIQFARSAEAQWLSDVFRAASTSGNEYELDPHVSLIYAHIPAEAKAVEAEQIQFSFSQVTFDAIQAVDCSTPIETRADVEGWQMVSEARLGG